MKEREIHESAPGGDGVTIRAVPQGCIGGVQIDEHLMASHPAGTPETAALCAIRKLQAGRHGLIIARTGPLASRMLQGLINACPPGFRPIKRNGDALRFPSGAIVYAAGFRSSFVGAVADWLWLETPELRHSEHFEKALRPAICQSRERHPVIVGAA